MMFRTFEVIDREKYDIVEKKEYKIKRLESTIERDKETIESIKKLIMFYTTTISELEKNIVKMSKELKELE